MPDAQLKVDVAGSLTALALAVDAANVDTAGSLPVADYDARTQLAAILAELAGTLDIRHATADGTWGYHAGTSGTPTITGRVIGITATGGTSAASFTINGGNTVTVPANMSIEVTPRGNLSAPTIVFTDTASYFVEVVS